MQLPRPYLYTSPRMVGLVDRPQMMPHEGPLIDPVYGYHTLWIAEVPFIPAFMGDGQKDFDVAASNRVSYAMQRQIRFLYDLAKSREDLSTFELRLVSWPQVEGLARVGIAFVGKTFHEDEGSSRHLALELWNKFSALFPREAPFSYPLVPVLEEDDGSTGQTHTFAQWYQPIPFENILQTRSLVELRKYEDWPTIRDVGGALHARDYIPHPFKAALDYSAMSRLFETLARMQKVCLASITLRPQRITDQEVVILNELLGWYKRVSRGEVSLDNPLTEVLEELNSDVFSTYLGTRAQLGCEVYENLVREQRSLFTVRLQVIGDGMVENDLIEALGSEVMANAGNANPSRWTKVAPENEQELRWAGFNLQWLEFARWGVSPIIRRVPSIIRLRQLATVPEAAGAFRLPVASADGGIAGIAVRDEPFGIPAIVSRSSNDTRFILGMQLDRGMQTELPLTLDRDILAKFLYLFGEAGKARDSVLQGLLKGATRHGTPWLLIRHKRADAASVTTGLPVRQLEIDLLEQAPKLPLQPFLPPPGVSYTVFLDAFVRVLTVTYNLEMSASIMLKRALVGLYERAGWTQQSDTTFDLMRLVVELDRTIQQGDGQEKLSAQLHAQCILPLQDLAMTLGNVETQPAPDNLRRITPLVIDIGWIGSDSNAILLQGCLWVWFALAFSGQSMTNGSGSQGFIGIEDVHTLFANHSALSPLPTSAFAHMLARKGVGMLLIDDHPDGLDQGITSGPGTTILTYNTNEAAVEKAAALTGIGKREKMRLRRLSQKEALVVQPAIAPILIAL